MCTGAEIAAAAAAAGETAAAAGGAATAAGAGAAAAGAGAAGAASAGALGAGAAGATALEAGGLGSLLAGSTAAEAAAAGGMTAAEAATAAGAADAAAAAGGAGVVDSAAGATLAAADMTPATLAAADTAAIPTVSAIGPAQGAVLNPGIQASGAEALAAPGASVAPAESTFLGMTPTQWTQQLIGQGGAMAMQALGAMQSQSELQDTADAYGNTVSDWEKAQLAAVDEGLSGFSAENIAKNRDKYQAEMMQTFDENAPTRASFGSLLLDSTPDEVKADYAAKQKASSDYARSQFEKSTALTSLGRAMTAGAQQMQDSMTRLNMNKYVLDGSLGSLNSSMQKAGQSGALYTGLGNLTSSLGNALLASQNSSGKKPASVTDIR